MIQATELTVVIMSNLFWLTDEQMERLKPFFPKSHGKPRVDDRRRFLLVGRRRRLHVVVEVPVLTRRQQCPVRSRPDPARPRVVEHEGVPRRDEGGPALGRQLTTMRGLVGEIAASTVAAASSTAGDRTNVATAGGCSFGVQGGRVRRSGGCRTVRREEAAGVALGHLAQGPALLRPDPTQAVAERLA